MKFTWIVVVGTILSPRLFAEMVELEDMSAYSIESGLGENRRQVSDIEPHNSSNLYPLSGLDNTPSDAVHSGSIQRTNFRSDDLSTIVPINTRIDLGGSIR